ncbi:MAG: phospholipase A [Sulfurimonas sp.]
MKKLLLILLFIATASLAIESKDERNLEMESFKKPDEEAMNSMNRWLDGVFSLQPHKPNYILPFGYQDKNYKSYDTNEYKNIEAELQVSLKLPIAKDLFNLGETYYLAYSHQAFWQIYIDSSPFRETNYNPEGFVVFPVLDTTSLFHMRSLKFAIAHVSNGQGDTSEIEYVDFTNPGNRSRSLNYFYVEGTFQHDKLVTELKLWSRFPENGALDDNPNLTDYTGFSEIKFSYFLRKHMFTLMQRGSFQTGKGATELTYSYPLQNDVYAYAKLFSGYGESLIDYDNHITKFSVGFSFSR